MVVDDGIGLLLFSTPVYKIVPVPVLFAHFAKKSLGIFGIFGFYRHN